MMRRSRFTQEQIIGLLKEHQSFRAPSFAAGTQQEHSGYLPQPGDLPPETVDFLPLGLHLAMPRKGVPRVRLGLSRIRRRSTFSAISRSRQA
jgi:hypothetical protein